MNRNAPPAIFDRRTVRMRRDRAAKSIDGHDFLFASVAESFLERIAFMKRDFARALVLGARDGGLCDALRRRPNTEQVVLADLSTKMLARRTGVRVALDDETLPFAEASFDLVLAPLSLAAVNDLPGALVQIRRVLRPDGLFLAAFYGGETLGELRRAFGEAEAAIEGGMSPRVAPVVDLRDMGGLLQRAGLALPVSDTEILRASYADALALMREIRAMGETSALAKRRRTFLRRTTLGAACDFYRLNFADAEGRVIATFEIVSVAAWAPHASQPKPLRPGSAKNRLADALGASETGTKKTD